MLGRRGKVSARGVVLRVKTRHYMVPPGTALLSALKIATGGFGVPINYHPEYGGELGIRVVILNDPRVSDVRSITFVGPVPILKERVKSYYLPMPPSERAAEEVVNSLIKVMTVVSNWGYAGLLIAQSHPRYALTIMSLTDRVKYPWRGSRSITVPYETTLLKLAEGVRYGDVVSVADGHSEAEISYSTVFVPRYEIGFAIYDQDITTLIYGYNPFGMRRAVETKAPLFLLGEKLGKVVKGDES